jgi:hypothetical protein
LTTLVPEADPRLRCSKCGSKRINSRPAWHTARDRWGRERPEREAIREMIRLRLKEHEPLRVVVQEMAKRGHKISHQSIVNIVKRQGELCGRP